MKKVIAFVYTILINLILLTICYKMFNPYNVIGFDSDISKYFSASPLTNIFMFCSIICLVITNVYLIKFRKNIFQ